MREIALLTLIVSSFFSSSVAFVGDLNHKLTNNLTKYEVTTAKNTPTDTKSIIAEPTKTTVDELANAAQAVYSVDLSTNTVLNNKNSDKKLQIASLTKLMTAYTALKDLNLTKTYTVPPFALQEGDSVAGLVAGDRLTGSDLLSAMLINSGSDAAQTIASLDAGSNASFVAKMNQNATELKLTNTHYANPVGWDDVNNYSTAKDMTELSRILLGNKEFSEIVSTKSKIITTEAGRQINLANTNQLLPVPGYSGVKTGFTNGAGECLISLNGQGKTQVLTTVLGSGNRFGETEQITTWIRTHFVWNL